MKTAEFKSSGINISTNEGICPFSLTVINNKISSINEIVANINI